MTERIDPRTTDLSRRDFLSAAAGLTLALTVTPDPLAILGVEDPSGTAKAEAALSPNVWLTISTDGTITIVSPAAEMGQGTFTTLPAVIADELDADWATVKPVFPPEWNERKFGNPGYATMRSRPRRVSRSAAISRRCGSRARRRGASSRSGRGEMGCPRRRAFDRAERGRAQVHRDAASLWRDCGLCQSAGKIPADRREADLKAPENFRHIGKDFADRTAAQSHRQGPIRHRRPGAGHGLCGSAAIALSGRRAGDGRRARARQVKGVTDIVRLPDGVGVVGTSVEATQAAKNLLG